MIEPEPEAKPGGDRVQYVQNGRPRFFPDRTTDELLAMIMALLGEVVVLRERVDTLERLAAARNVWTRQQIEDFVPDEAAERERAALRTAALDRVMSVLNEEIVRLRHETR